MSALIDQAERDRFVTGLEKNISVIAPAGVGKTTSIIARILHLAQLQPEDAAVDRLSRLVVVTYSVRAAQQMQQKARVAIREAKLSSRVQRAFQQTFFGTIHSYCVRLLEQFGHYLGLPSPVGLLQADDELWPRFLLRGLGPEIASAPEFRDLFHFYAPEKLYALGREISPGAEIAVEPLPALDLRKLFDYRDDALHHSTKKTITRAQEAAKRWSEAWNKGDRFRPLPKCPESDKATAFAEIWNAAFAPLHSWLREAALAFGRHVANAYERFRLAEAVMTYDDQVRLALEVLDLPVVRRELAAEKLSVLLDEAQDTDPRQFQVLLRVAGLENPSDQAADQNFAIVGDFQQAIYAPRSDLTVYRGVHDRISVGSRGASSRLAVTFRCDQAVIDFVNRVFPSLLDDTAGQSAFTPLAARAQAAPGCVVRWTCPALPEPSDEKKISAEARARHEARYLAQQIKALGPAGLGAEDWSDVAILCPRKNWLLQIQRELVVLDLPVQLHSSNEEQGDRTPAAWLTALLWVAAHPEDTFEIAGVLREIFGVPDHDMARFTGGDGDKLRLDRPAASPETAGPVESALHILRSAVSGAESLPLHRAVLRLVDQTDLRRRLLSIPDLELENAGRELDDLLALVAARAADGVTLADLARDLRLGLAQPHPAEEEIRDAIQLLTSHKAKGLEWRVVLAPFVFRPIESKAVPYPRLVQLEAGKDMVIRDKADLAREARAFLDERERQQLQRLLYVTCTRAKQTLVLVDDEALFAEQIRRSGSSAGELLGFSEGANRAAWLELPATFSPADAPSPKTAASEPTLLALPDFSAADFHHAVARAAAIPRRITPHALAVHRPAEAEPEADADAEREDEPHTGPANNPGILYGTWWHEFIQTIPWHEPAAWPQKFLQAQARSPQPARSAQEWEIFLRSPLADWLAEPGRVIQVEFPFLWRKPGGPCVEGVIDLAVFSANDSTCHVIDWKTNRLDPADPTGAATEIVEIYRAQISAYLDVLRDMLSADARGSLYLTATGAWLEVQ